MTIYAEIVGTLVLAFHVSSLARASETVEKPKIPEQGVVVLYEYYSAMQ